VDVHRHSLRATGAGDPISPSHGLKPSQIDDARNVPWLEEPISMDRIAAAEESSLCVWNTGLKMMSLAAMQQKRHHLEHEARN
jgi:hypothetical protein